MRRENNFDLLRLLLAWLVVVVHTCDLSSSPQLLPLRSLLSTRVPVEGFFAISGCLIVASWDRSQTASGYLRRRARRILPGYWLAFLYTLVLGAFATTLPLASFLRSTATWKFALANLSFANWLVPDLPGVFTHNTASFVNGALWTIKVELMFYLFVPALVWCCRRIGAGWTLGGCFVLSVLYRLGFEARGHHSLALQLPGQLAFFVVGAAVYFYFAWFQNHRRLVWIVAILSTALGCYAQIFPLRALGIPLLVMCLGLLLPPVRGVTRFGDFSYGTYVLHFPTVQLFVSLGLFASSPWLALAIVSGTVATLAVASWYTVERHFLSPARVAAAEPAVATATA